jgi:hypothetical protein
VSEERRGILTIGLWFLSAIVLAALFIAAAAQGELTPLHAALASVMLALATIGTVSILRMKDSETQPEKAKRGHLASLLDDLTDDELAELKHRLTGNDSDNEDIATYLDDDGEIRHRR